MDLFCVDGETGATLAVEAKLRDWRRALRQAEAYKFAADVVYLALPDQTVSESCRAACVKSGVGIFAVPEKGKFMPRLNGQVHEHKRSVFSHRALTFVGRRVAFAILYA